MAQGVASKVFPDVFRRVQFGRVRGQLQQDDIVWHDQLWRSVPSGPIHDEQGECSSSDAFADFNQMLVHGFNVDGRQHQGGANTPARANRAEEIGPGEAPVARRARTASTPGPDARHRALLSDPGFVLKPDFNWPAASAFTERLFCQVCEVF